MTHGSTLMTVQLKSPPVGGLFCREIVKRMADLSGELYLTALICCSNTLRRSRATALFPHSISRASSHFAAKYRC
jgi:hypothetical protein